MKVSLNTVKSLIAFELPPVAELKKRIDEQLGKVEKVIDLGAQYKGAVIAKVVSAEKHPNADKLTVCKIDDGGTVKDVPRDENGHVQVVCGAPNVHADMFAVWLPPNATVPASFDDAEPFVLSARELRGVLSQGMLAAGDELAIGGDHNGIIELAEIDLPLGVEAKALTPGQDFAELFGMDDVVLDIENKMFTHRPDCFGQLGVAREISGILGHKFTSPDWYLNIPEFQNAEGLELTVKNDATEKVPRFMAVALKDVTIKPSPFWLQCELVRLGSKPINNIVDITNYVMLLTAQPLHAYDYDKLAGHTLGVRMGRDGEKLPLLNGKTYEVSADDIVIVDGEKPIGMGGIMGGGNSEVSAGTKNIVLECATFDMYTIRKTSMRHGLFTDAVTRFNKGQSPLQNDRVLNVAMLSMFDVAGGAQASKVFDESAANQSPTDVQINSEFINARLGSRLTNDEIAILLDNVEVKTGTGDALNVHVPFWRTDIEQPEDVVEEVGRLYGFDKLPLELPTRSLKPAAKNAKREVAHKIRESLSKAGANEVLTYSFVHKDVMERAGQDVAQAFQLSNALSPDLQYYRLSVTPSLFDKIHPNIKAGHDEFALFEIGKGHNKKYHADDDNGLPKEMEFVDVVYAAQKPRQGAPYFYMRRLVQQLALDLGFTVKFAAVNDALDLDYPLTAPFARERSAIVTAYKQQDEACELGFVGMIGELKPSVRKAFKLPEYTAAATLDIQGLVQLSEQAGHSYAPLSKFPTVTQDISLKVAADVAYETVYSAVLDVVRKEKHVDAKLSPLDVYQAPNDAAHRTVTLRLEVAHYDKTLTDKDVTALLERAATAAAKACGAQRV